MTNKAAYRRYAKVGNGGVTCPCCGGPACMRHSIKKAARHSFARIIDRLAADELAPEPELPRYRSEIPCWANPHDPADERLLIEYEREQLDYVAWTNKQPLLDWTPPHGWRDKYAEDSMYDSMGYNSEYEYRRHEMAGVINTNHGYSLIPSTVDLNTWDVVVLDGYIIGAITLDGFEWRVTFYKSGRHYVVDTFTFDYMESSLDAAFALIQTLHRLDCGSEV